MAALSLIVAGNVFAESSGPVFTNFYTFTGVGDGANPQAGLILSSNGTTLYGTASRGGSNNQGTLFAIRTDGSGFTNLHSFTGGNDGANPQAGLILSSNGTTFYGTAYFGGSNGNGTIFAIQTNGSGFTNLHTFTAEVNNTQGDGAFPPAGLILSSNGTTLYGTAYFGGSHNKGTLFAIRTDGSGFTNLHSFTGGNDGAYPQAGLILSSNGTTLYGTAYGGGSNGNGTLFAIQTDGTGFTTLYSFTPEVNNTNGDGANPQAGLILSSNGTTLYGTAYAGGSNDKGTLFAIQTDGSGYTNLHSFTGGTGGNDGAYPQAGLILSSNGTTLYGTAYGGGTNRTGTLFSIQTDGSGYTNLYTFTATSGFMNPTNGDGANPKAGLILSSNGTTLYGTAYAGGSNGNGTLFALDLMQTQQGTNPQSIKFGALKSSYMEIGTAPFALKATASSGLPVSFDVTGPALLSNNLVVITAAGTVTIVASQAGNSNYAAAPDVSHDFMAVKHSQKITFIQPSTRMYSPGGTFGLAVASQGGSVILTSSDTNVITVSGNTATIHGVGTSKITANQSGNGIYAAAPPVTCTVTVKAGMPSIGALSLPSGETAGSPNATISNPSSTSSGAFSYKSSNTKVATVTGNVIKFLKAGTTTITATQAAKGNYLSGTVSAVLTVASAH